MVFEVACFALATAVQVDDLAVGDLREVAARLLGAGHLALVHQVQVDVVGQVRRIHRVAELAPQQVAQPAVMILIQLVQLLTKRERSVVHGTSP